MSYGPKQVFSGGVIASATSTGTWIDFGTKAFSKMAVKFPSMSTAGVLTIYGCETSTGTFQPIKERVPNTTSVQYQNLSIATAVSGSWAIIEALPLQFIKFVSDVTVTDGSGAITVVAQD